MSDCPMHHVASACFSECAWWMGGKCAKVRQAEALERIALYLNPAAEHKVVAGEIEGNFDELFEKMKGNLEKDIRRQG